MVGGAGRAAPKENHGDRVQRGSLALRGARGRLFLPTAPTHAQGQTGRGGLRARAAGAAGLEKKALAEDADFVLIYQDEREIHRHPALTRMWAPVGQQPE